MKVIIAAGGTGGHIYPGIAIAEEVIARDKSNDVLFIGSTYGLEKKLVEKESFRIELIMARGILRKLSLRSIIAPFLTLFGFFQSISIIWSYKPDIVVLTGGYVSFPVAAAAKIMRIKTLLAEQNVLPGFTNRFMSKFVDVIAFSFPETAKYLHGVCTGNPVRKRIKEIKKSQGKTKRVLVMGGSQGALSLNKAILSNIELYRGQGIDIYHIIGTRDFDVLTMGKDFSQFPFYHPISYMYNIEECLAIADLVVSRAGATAIAEFLVLGIPMILIPFPYAAENHQEYNAKVVEAANAAVVLNDDELQELPKTIFTLLDNDKKLSEMSDAALRLARPKAAAEIYDLCKNII